MRKKFVKTSGFTTKDHKRKKLTRNQLRLILSATTLCAILTGCGANDKVTTEEVESDLVQTEASENGEYSYLYDRLADEYGEFKIDVKEDGKIYSIVVSVDDEQIFDYELTYDEVSKVYTCDENIILSDIELVDGNVEYVTTTEVVEITDLEYDKKDVDTKDYGKRFKIEEVEVEELEDKGIDTTEIEDDETVYKVTYLDLGGKAEEEVETEVTTEGMTTETVVDNEVETPDTPTNPTTPSTPSNNGGSNNGGNNSSQQSNNDENSGNNGGGYTPAPTNPTPSTPTTETPSVPDTTETPSTPTTEEVHQHNWVETTGYKSVYSHCEQVCVYCGYRTRSLDDCINHVSVCGGVWTHEELKDKDPYVYNALLGQPKGSNYYSDEIWVTEEYTFEQCSDCGAVK